jgi:hypothetical protein
LRGIFRNSPNHEDLYGFIHTEKLPVPIDEVDLPASS